MGSVSLLLKDISSLYTQRLPKVIKITTKYERKSLVPLHDIVKEEKKVQQNIIC